ncbi:flagellar protein FlgN [Wansuia hejianensis]|uniref:Flagellar protein FlgN n=1 Tax=Wansuia hejianensis TaxID=2763667 RepID=A0A926EZD2_9FIRM|nr:flagellar protein FlgN [Wansuia hejianensis]MBC8590327.1 hypothetical protein [Wansuia hejianensis]
MTAEQELLGLLKSIEDLLEEEKKALLENNGEKVAEIVQQKNKCIDRLSEFKGMNMDKNQKIVSLIEEINTKQELNLLLTQQALDYQNALLESISQNMKNESNTYSSKGNYQKKKSINLIDQSV